MGPDTPNPGGQASDEAEAPASASQRLDPFAALDSERRKLAAVTELAPSGDAERHLTFEGLVQRALGLARMLKLGAEVGEPTKNLALLSKNRTEYIEVVLASIAGGAWLTPINWHLTAPEIAYILEDSESTLVIADPSLSHLLPEGCEPLLLGEAYEALLLEHAGAAVSEVYLVAEGELTAAPGLDPDATPGGIRIYTSGTSGRPKGVERQRASSVERAWAGLRDAGAALGLTTLADPQREQTLTPDQTPPLQQPEQVHLITGPMYHAAPLMFAIYDLLGGARVCVMPEWDEGAFLNAVGAQRVTHTHVVPTMCVRLLALEQSVREAADLSSLSLVLHGAAPISEAVKRRMIEWFGPKLLEYWGATEGGVYTLIDSADWLSHPGSVGKPLSKYRVFAVSDTVPHHGALAELPPGEIGTLYCQHLELERPFVYHRAEEKTQASYLAPGVFTAGDLGHVDADGYVYLSARRSNLILSGGVNVYPAEVEAELLEEPWVADVAVFGAPDAEWGEQVRAAVELSALGRAQLATLGEQELVSRLLEALSSRLAKYKRPRSVVLVDVLPRLPTGKVRHEALREL